VSRVIASVPTSELWAIFLSGLVRLQRAARFRENNNPAVGVYFDAVDFFACLANTGNSPTKVGHPEQRWSARHVGFPSIKKPAWTKVHAGEQLVPMIEAAVT
jgi:hypothetical protein